MQVFITIVAIMASITGALLWVAPNILIRIGDVLNLSKSEIRGIENR